ncbi:hypothetical protein G3480_22895 [Thiorhodococcus mannitoliphagus]|uniref:YcxB family protein n=1 Tax=Thiorhodococcus mannitoliphagus TaxID=329406 RepID=A0A6P1E023_9GAMM|nr:hypothetical protein [Thiorhodococcus mannitoliphagus]NEX23110.1 hypothetical protein [Thiorhodococcus mannitoliphagus]
MIKATISMEQTFLYQFQSVYMTWYILGGVTFVGFGLGFAFWLDFRRRLSQSWHIAGLIVLFAGSLIGVFFGYQATQPEYFKKLTANDDGIRFAYHLFTSDVFLRWSDIRAMSIQNNRLVIETRQAATYSSPVVYRGNQEQLLSSISRLMPTDHPRASSQ